MRISDWSSDVCSSDLTRPSLQPVRHIPLILRCQSVRFRLPPNRPLRDGAPAALPRSGSSAKSRRDRKRAGEGKSVGVRVDLGDPRTLKKKIDSLRIGTIMSVMINTMLTSYLHIK